jgi:uncharacterized protein
MFGVGRVSYQIGVLLAALAGLISNPVSGQSFDCDKASNFVERTICANPQMARSDELMFAEFIQAIGRLGTGDTVRASQRQWLVSRNSCRDENCIRQHYERRVAELRSLGRQEQSDPALAAMLREREQRQRQEQTERQAAQEAALREAEEQRRREQSQRRTVQPASPGSAVASATGPAGAAETLARAQEALMHRDLATAIRLLVPLAEAGDGLAMHLLGTAYAHTGDMTRAQDWMRRGEQVVAAQNAARSVRRDSDIPPAIALLRPLAEQGHVPSMLELGRLYLAGSRPDPSQALHWYERAARAGNAEAQARIPQIQEAERRRVEAERLAAREREEADRRLIEAERLAAREREEAERRRIEARAEEARLAIERATSRLRTLAGGAMLVGDVLCRNASAELRLHAELDLSAADGSVWRGTLRLAERMGGGDWLSYFTAAELSGSIISPVVGAIDLQLRPQRWTVSVDTRLESRFGANLDLLDVQGRIGLEPTFDFTGRLFARPLSGDLTCAEARLREAHTPSVWQAQVERERRQIATVLERIPALRDAPEDAAVLLALPNNGPNARRRLDGSVVFPTGTANICLVASAFPDPSFRDWVVREAGNRTSTRITTSCAHGTLDVMAMRRFALPILTPASLDWLAGKGAEFVPLATLTLGEHQRFLAELRAAEERRQLEARTIEERRNASRAENLSLIQAAPANAPLQQGRLSQHPLLLFSRGTGTQETCHYTDSDVDAVRREQFLAAIRQDQALGATEPLIGETGGLRRLRTAENIYEQIQGGRCGMVMGTPAELKPLVEGVARLAGRAPTVLALSFAAADVQRIANAERDRQVRAEAEADRAERQREREEQARAREAARRGTVSYQITCRMTNGRPMPLAHCLMSGSAGGPGGRIAITSGGNTEEINHIAMHQRFGGSGIMSGELERPWRIMIQAGNSEFLILRAEVTLPSGQTMSEEVSRFRAVSLRP